MARTQQDILVKIRVLLEGLGGVRALAGHVKELGTAGGQGGRVTALAGDIDKLSAAVDRLATSQEKASSKGGFVRFLVGANAVINALATLPQAFAGLEKLFDFLDNVGGGVGKAFGKVKEFASSLFSTLSQFAGSVGSHAGADVAGLGAAASGLGAAFVAALPVIAAVGAALAVVLAAVAALAVAFTGLAASVGLGFAALLKIGPAGIELNSQLEQAKLGVAAVISSLAQLKVDGKPVEGAEKLTAAFQLADDQVQKLRVDAINTTATFEQILPAFQEALAPGLAAGLTLDEVRKVTVQVVQAAGALNIPLNQVNQEVRAILEGSIDVNARLAKALGISSEDVKLWKKKGTLADELNKKLAAFTVAGNAAADTLEGLKSNLQEALNVFNQEATTRAFGALKDEFRRLLPQLFDFKNSTVAAQFKTLAQLADDVLVRVIRIGGSIAQGIVSGLKRAADFVSQNKATIDDILNLVEGIVRQLISAGGVIARVATDTSTWKSLLDSVRGVLVLINIALAIMVAELQKAEPLLRLAALAGAVLIASSPALAVSSGGTTAATKGANQQDLDNESQRLRDKQSGRKIDVGALPRVGGGGGKKGGGGHKSKVPELQRNLDRATIDAALAELTAKSELVRQNIDASVEAVRNGLDDSIISISEAYRLEAALADKALQNELTRIAAEKVAAKERRDLAVKDLDPDLKPEEKRLAIAAEDKKLAAEITKLEGERRKLTEETADKKAALVRDEAKETKALQDSLADIENQLDSLSRFGSARAEAAAREIEARFEKTREGLVANFGEASEQVRQLDELISLLTSRAKFQELAKDVSTALGKLRDFEQGIAQAVESGQISAEEGLKRRLALERQVRREVLEHLVSLQKIADASKDPELAAAIRQLALEWDKLGQHIDETARRLDESIKTGLIDSLTDIITRTKSVGEAFRALAQTILAEIARIVATKFVEKIFGGLLQTNTSGNSIGGVISGILNFGGGFAEGGVQPATPGGRLIRVAEAGHDEVVLTTDPKHRGRTSRLLGQFLRRTGLTPDFSSVVLQGALAGVPSFAAGGFVLGDVNPPAQVGGDIYNVKVDAPIQTATPQAFKNSEQAVHRTIARATMDGLRRAKSRPKV